MTAKHQYIGAQTRPHGQTSVPATCLVELPIVVPVYKYPRKQEVAEDKDHHTVPSLANKEELKVENSRLLLCNCYNQTHSHCDNLELKTVEVIGDIPFQMEKLQ